MPTPSDGTAVPERSYEEMVKQAQDSMDEANRAVEERKANFSDLQQRLVPNTEFPGSIGTRSNE